MFKKNISMVIMAFVSLIVLMTGCNNEDTATSAEGVSNNGENNGSSETNSKGDRDREGWPEELIISAIPSEDVEAVTDRYSDFAEYLENRLDIPVSIFVGTDYTAAVEATRAGHAHIGFWGPFSYVLANQRAGAEAFATTLSDGQGHYNAAFLALNDSGIESVADLEGKTIGWVDPASTSGNLFPKAHLMSELGMEDESELDSFFANQVYTGGHDSTFVSVLNGDIDAGPFASSHWERRLEQFSDHPRINDIEIFEMSADIPRSPVSYQSDLPEDLKKEIREAFFDILNHPELADYIEEQELEDGYIEVDDSRYDVIRETADILGLDLSEME